MNVQTNKEAKGFTIIEVVLVLAIAGLIFLMVFIALPALQRSQRDTQRRDDVARFVSQLNSYATNNKGNLPGEDQMGGGNGFLQTYMKSGGEEFNDPLTGDAYSADAAAPTTKKLQYDRGVTCGGAAGGNRQAAVRIALESGGDFCQDVK